MIISILVWAGVSGRKQGVTEESEDLFVNISIVRTSLHIEIKF